MNNGRLKIFKSTDKRKTLAEFGYDDATGIGIGRGKTVESQNAVGFRIDFGGFPVLVRQHALYRR